jgi:hypothetical protein
MDKMIGYGEVYAKCFLYLIRKIIINNKINRMINKMTDRMINKMTNRMINKMKYKQTDFFSLFLYAQKRGNE